MNNLSNGYCHKNDAYSNLSPDIAFPCYKTENEFSSLRVYNRGSSYVEIDMAELMGEDNYTHRKDWYQ
jgi:hypothetical protein